MPRHVSLSVRHAIRESDESIRALARRYNINPKTVVKWKRRTDTASLSPGPKARRSTTISLEEETLCVSFRAITSLPIDDCLYVLNSVIPQLSRSTLYRMFRRHNVHKISDIDHDIKIYPEDQDKNLADYHIFIADVFTDKGLIHIYSAIERSSRYHLARIMHEDNAEAACDFLEWLSHRAPRPVGRAITVEEAPFSTLEGGDPSPFSLACKAWGIKHVFLPTRKRWSNRTQDDGEAVIPVFQLEQLVHNFTIAANYRRRMKALGGLTPFEFICRDNVDINPRDQMKGAANSGRD